MLTRLVVLALLALVACSGGVSKTGQQTVPLVTLYTASEKAKLAATEIYSADEKAKLAATETYSADEKVKLDALPAYGSAWSAPSFTATAGSGENGVVLNEGARILFRAGQSTPTLYAAPGQTNTVGVSGTLYVYGTGSVGAGGGVFYTATTNTSSMLRGNATDGASAIGVRFANNNALTTLGAKIAAFYSDNGATERAFIDKDGAFTAKTGSGANGFALTTNGARLDLGTGANDYFASNGTTISTPGDLSVLSVTASATTSALPAPAWTAASLATGWTNLGSNWATAAYYKDAVGMVHVRGIVVKGGGSGNVIFTLPAGFRPATGQNHNFVGWAGTGVAVISVSSNGEVAYVAGGTPSSDLGLAGIHFRAEQ